MEALGRDSSFDQRLDSIVRVQATHVRRKLREYYQGPGKDDTVTISLPAGTYVPSFKYRSHFQCGTTGTADAASQPSYPART